MRKEVCVNSPDAGTSQVELEKNVCFKGVQIRDLSNLHALGCSRMYLSVITALLYLLEEQSWRHMYQL